VQIPEKLSESAPVLPAKNCFLPPLSFNLLQSQEKNWLFDSDTTPGSSPLGTVYGNKNIVLKMACFLL
jgi:hypothetical protein